MIGFVHFSSTADPLYQFVFQAMAKINASLLAKNYNTSQIVYRDIVYKLSGQVLTILLKVQIVNLIFTYQYSGTIGK